jgi:hypothetical protein
MCVTNWDQWPFFHQCVGAYFFWPAAVTAGAMMKAPGAAGFLISRAAFVANPQLYFEQLRNAGDAVAAAAFAA